MDDIWETAIRTGCNLTRRSSLYGGECTGQIPNPTENCYHLAQSIDVHFQNSCIEKCCMAKQSFSYEATKHVIAAELFSDIGCQKNESSVYLKGIKLKPYA